MADARGSDRSKSEENGQLAEAGKIFRAAFNPNPTLFRISDASEPYSRGQWDSALKAAPHAPTGDFSYVGA